MRNESFVSIMVVARDNRPIELGNFTQNMVPRIGEVVEYWGQTTHSEPVIRGRVVEVEWRYYLEATEELPPWDETLTVLVTVQPLKEDA